MKTKTLTKNKTKQKDHCLMLGVLPKRNVRLRQKARKLQVARLK